MKKKVIPQGVLYYGYAAILRSIYFGMLFVVLCMSVGCGKEEGILLTENTEEKELVSSEKSEDGMSDTSQNIEKEPVEENHSNFIYVQVSGAVVNPNVYALAEGSRIFQAIELAGGVTKEADIRSLNQAEILKDGQMVYVMNVEETAAGEQPESGQKELEQADDRINLNTATEAELTTLPGIGTAKAKSILAWREENGSFQQIEDLMKIEGIKTGVFSKIKDSIKVD